MAERSDTAPRKELLIAIAPGPECPHCREGGFDDWHHDPSMKASGGVMRGRLRCHGCGKFFSLTFIHGMDVHSTAWRKVA